MTALVQFLTEHEELVEGSLWVYGRTDLADFYRGDLSLRQIKVRLLALPHEPPNRAPTWDVLLAEQEKSEGRQRVSEVEETLARFKS